MKSLRLLAAFVLLALTAACAAPPTGTTAAPTTASSFNANVQKGEQALQTVQKASTSLLRAGSLTLAQDQLIQKQCDLIESGIELAKGLQSKDPVAATAQLTSVLTQLGALKTQTGVTTP